jgi:hypothetical protein
MILNASSKIALKCDKCGRFNVYDINMFKLGTSNSFKCSCGHTTLRAGLGKGEFHVEIGCIACEETHMYRMKLREVMERPINIIGCPHTGMEIAFLGWEEYVESFIEEYTKDMNKLLRYLGMLEKRAKA